MQNFPKVGKKIKAGEAVVVLESTKAAADVYSPVSGEIIAVNTSLEQQVQLINTSPEIEGWLFKIALEDTEEVNRYLETKDYEALIRS